MAAGPVQAFSRDNVKARWAERYTSEAINKKFLGTPRGIYLGFIPSASGLILSLQPDKVITFSALAGGFTIGATLTGPSGTAIIRAISTGFLLVSDVTGTFLVSEALSDSATSVSAVVETFVEEDVSFGRVVSSSTLSAGRSEHMLDVFTTDTITLDFTGFTDGTYYVILTASYQVGATTIASIITRTTPPPNGVQEVLICKVTKVGASITTIEATSPETRNEPVAFEGQRHGFMPGGSVERLLSATTSADEVIASRRLSDGTAGTPFSSGFPQTTGVPLRLNTDLSNVSMANRLGKTLISVQGNNFTLSAPATSANVSTSFGARNRDFEPYRDQSPATGITIPAGVPTSISADGIDFVELTLTGVAGVFTVGLLVTGTDSDATAIIKSVSGSIITVGDFIGSLFNGELITQASPAATGTISAIALREGAITGLSGGAVSDQNIVAIVDEDTGNKAIDTSTSAVTVFGRLIYGPGGSGAPGEHQLAAGQQLNFTAGSVVVTVAAGTITTPGEIDVGDLIEGDDGRFYEVDLIAGSPITSFNLPVTKDYVGPTAINIGSRRRRRFILEFKRVVAGTEGAATLAAGTYRFFFPAWFTSEKSNFDATHNRSASGGTQTPLATTTVEGRVIAATGSPSPAQAGAFNEAENNGVSVAGGNAPYYKLNFLGGGVTSPSAGELDIPSAGLVVSRQHINVTGHPTSSTIMTYDNVIPVITEGVEFAQLTVAAQSAGNWLYLHYMGMVASNTSNVVPIIALFWDSVTDAIQANMGTSVEPESIVVLDKWFQPGDMSSHIYKIRIGPHIAGTLKASAASGGLNDAFGGIAHHTFTILEYTA